MRKLLFTLTLFLSILSAMPAGAQTITRPMPRMTVGLGAGYVSRNNGAYADVYFQYLFMRYLRAQADVGYSFRSKDKAAFLVNVDLQVPMKMTRGLNFFPLVGFSYQNWNLDGDVNHSRAGLNMGGGIELNFTPQLKVSIQGKYTLMKDYGSAFVGAGIGYKF